MKIFILQAFVLMTITACTTHAEKKLSQAICSDLSVQVLGAGGPEINDGLASASFLIWKDGKARLIIDAGGGSSLNFEKSNARFNDISTILLTHLHVDHSAEIPVYIKSGYFTHRSSNLNIFGPGGGGGFPSTENFIKALFSDQQSSVYPYLSDNIRQQPSTDFLVIPYSVTSQKKVWEKQLRHGIKISAINVHHGDIPALAWRISTKNCSITFSGDMNASTLNLISLAQNSDILIANNAIPEDANNSAKQLHMIPSQIGEIAKAGKVRMLLLAHFMNRTKSKKIETMNIISEIYSGKIVLAEESVIY